MIFYGNVHDVNNKTNFFQSFVSPSNFGTHNTLIEIGQNVTTLFATISCVSHICDDIAINLGLF
jgi:hypothetical protein